LYSSGKNADAASDSIGVILMAAVTILLALLVLLMLSIQPFAWNLEKELPEIFTITAIESIDEITGHLNFDSRVILLHSGGITYQNKNLTARFFKNGQPVPCVIKTLNGHDFINTVHSGVQWIGGSGCSGATWEPGERICIDFTDGTFHPGDEVQVDILDNRDVTISRHMFRYE
jgi:hypothetical protein